MIEYILPHSPDDRIINKAISLIKSGKLICFPTDTNWIIAGNLKDKGVMEQLQKLKNEDEHKHFSLLCPSISMASEYALINDQAFKLLKRMTPGNYTFIFNASKLTTKAIKASKTDHEVGLRFVPSPLVTCLLDAYGDCLVSTNITKSMLNISDDEEIYSYQIEDKLSHLLGMIIDPGEIEFAGQSTILSFLDDNLEVIREGAGPLPF
jgi:tRNA threonylcarbamoyl adenosine modification protein (Sua5/YciO/YrdC/YwlC family)